jgi:choice-of-anchor B domain-containing protein
MIQMRTLVILASLIPMIGFGQISMNVDLLFNWNDTLIPDNGSGATYNETWGFVQDGVEYGVIGSTLGTHFFQLTANDELVLVDYVPGRFQGPVVHRDYHDHDGYLYAICQQGGSSLQIMDLQYLPDSVSVVYDSDTLFSIAHNVYIDTATSKLYVDSPPGVAMTVYDISDPIDPVLTSIFTDVGSVHDCFVRNDTAYLNCGTDGLFVYDFSTGFTPQIIGSLTSYPDQGYNHSGWLSVDGDTYVMADETNGMRMKVCDVSDLNDITPQGLFNSGVDTNTVPHNLMLKEDLVYVSHYNDGLRIFDISDPLNPAMVGYYDTYPAIDTASAFRGAWGIYSFFPSGRLLISDRQTGLYLFRYNDPTAGIVESPEVGGFTVFPNPNEGAFTLNVNRQTAGLRLLLFSSSGRLVFEAGPLSSGLHQIRAEGLAPGIYVARFGTESQRLVVR